jgi:hypothetical protein
VRALANTRNDPYIDDTPWEIFYDDNGRAIGDLYTYSEPEHDRISRKGAGGRGKENEIYRSRPGNRNGVRRFR